MSTAFDLILCAGVLVVLAWVATGVVIASIVALEQALKVGLRLALRFVDVQKVVAYWWNRKEFHDWVAFCEQTRGSNKFKHWQRFAEKQLREEIDRQRQRAERAEKALAATQGEEGDA